MENTMKEEIKIMVDQITKADYLEIVYGFLKQAIENEKKKDI